MKGIFTSSTARLAALLGASLLILSACHYHHPYGGYYGYGYGHGYKHHYGYGHRHFRRHGRRHHW